MEHEHRTRDYTLEYHDILNSATALASSLQGKRWRAPCFPSTCDFPVSSQKDVTVFSLIHSSSGLSFLLLSRSTILFFPLLPELCLLRSACSQTNQHKYTFIMPPFLKTPYPLLSLRYPFTSIASTVLALHSSFWRDFRQAKCSYQNSFWIRSTLSLKNMCMQIFLICKWSKFRYSDFNFLNSFLSNTYWTSFICTSEKRGKTLIWTVAGESTAVSLFWDSHPTECQRPFYSSETAFCLFFEEKTTLSTYRRLC